MSENPEVAELFARAEAGTPEAQRQLGYRLSHDGQEVDGMGWIAKAAEQGDAEAIQALYLMAEAAKRMIATEGSTPERESLAFYVDVAERLASRFQVDLTNEYMHFLHAPHAGDDGPSGMK